MREFWRFFRRDTPLLTYGVSLTFLSSVGQTFLVPLFVPHFLEAFALSEGGLGMLYSGATLGSALLLSWVGRWLDREHLHRFTLGVLGLLAAAAFPVAGAWHVAVLGVALPGVRLGGQGLSSHTALTAMARYFETGRGMGGLRLHGPPGCDHGHERRPADRTVGRAVRNAAPGCDQEHAGVAHGHEHGGASPARGVRDGGRRAGRAAGGR